jgi:oxygen-independent coproporphyrinogen III oxidase
MTGFYFHIPFCDKKCTYCDFYSIESKGLMGRFVDTLVHEMTLRADAQPTSDFTVFFGGGTPSLLAPTQLERILSNIAHLDDAVEVTMECNPGTVTLENLKAYRSLGIDRLSFGVQSFVQEELDFLTRIHTADEAREAMRLARAAGFENVNMDLMFAMPVQTRESLQFNIHEMLKLAPDHISAYSLTYEPGTPLYTQKTKGLIAPHNEEVDADMYAIVIDRLTAAGYEQYEVSNFAKPGHRCAHNLVYWHGEDHLSVGPSAHGLVGGRRYWNHRSLTSWTQKVEANELPEANDERIDEQKRMMELAFLTIRADGMPMEQFRSEFDIDLRSALQPDLQYWSEAGMVEERDGVLRLTSKGYVVCDEITIKVESLLDAYSLSDHRP